MEIEGGKSTILPYKDEEEFLKDLEDALFDYLPDKIIPKVNLVQFGENIDHLLKRFL